MSTTIYAVSGLVSDTGSQSCNTDKSTDIRSDPSQSCLQYSSVLEAIGALLRLLSPRVMSLYVTE